MKNCTTCQQVKPLTEFYKNNKSKDGVGYKCVVCSKEYTANTRKNRPELVKARVANWRDSHKKEMREYSKKWKENNPDKVAKNSKKFREENKDKEQNWSRNWYLANKERVAANVKRWRAENPEKKRQQSFNYRAQKKNAEFGLVDIKSLISEWDMSCGICKEGVEGQYHIDHIMPLSKGGKHTQENLQITHPVCNLRKGNKVLA